MTNTDNIIDQALGIFDPVETELKKAVPKTMHNQQHLHELIHQVVLTAMVIGL